MGKSAAKIRRNQARAAARGETYAPPKKESDDANVECDEVIQIKAKAAEKLERSIAEIEANHDNLNSKNRRSARRMAEAVAAEEAGVPAEELLSWYGRYKMRNRRNTKTTKQKKNNQSLSDAEATKKLSQEDQVKLLSAKKLKESLSQLELDDSLNAKERRSAKRKAEAIATEETGCSTNELLEWFEKFDPPTDKKHPYIVFVGQLSYSTTSDMLFNHFQSKLGQDKISSKSVKVRLLTDPGTKKSRGMAFVELESPEIMYECLKLHLTFLDGRRINVERTSGGGSLSKKSKITSFREKQSTYISQTMDHILSTYIKTGDIDADELDQGVISLCKRHSAAVVEQALKEFVEEKKLRKIHREKLGENEEEELRNPSAFLTHMIGRISEEGLGSDNSKKRSKFSGTEGKTGENNGETSGRYHSSKESEGVTDTSCQASSEVKVSNIFPSMRRGRGRGH